MIVSLFVTNFGGIESTCMSQKITFSYADRSLHLRHKTQIKEGLIRLFKKEGKLLGGINYVFCSDEYLLEINRQFLQHDYYTDIITFGLSEPKRPIEAEIYISVDRVKDNAKTVAETYTREMLRVIIHGALHLCGYKDKTKAQSDLMRSKENYYLSLFS